MQYAPQQVTFNKKVESSDINTPVNQAATVINGNIGSDNLLNGGVTPDKLNATAGNTWAWQSWTPTFTNFTLGNGTVVAKYSKIGKTVICKFKVALGTTSIMGLNITFSTPTNTAIDIPNTSVGTIYYEKLAILGFEGVIRLNPNTVAPIVINTAGTYAASNTLGTNQPFVWGAGDFFAGTFTYEEA
jgi:hypothetical protein